MIVLKVLLVAAGLVITTIIISEVFERAFNVSTKGWEL